MIAAVPGDFGKPRPSLIVQADLLTFSGHESVLIASMSTTLTAQTFRLGVAPDEANGLRSISEIRLDRIFARPREKLGEPVGRLSPEQMRQVDALLAFVLGLGA